MSFIRKYYDKLILVFAFVFTTVLSLLTFLGSDELNPSSTKIINETYTIIGNFEGERVLSLSKKSHLLPNDIITFYHSGDEDSITAQITKVIFKKKSSVIIKTLSGKNMSGRLLGSNDLILEDAWNKSRIPIALDTREGGVVNLNANEIKYIHGDQKLILDNNLKILEDENYSVSVYQTMSHLFLDINQTEKTRWTNNVSEKNETIYDLFTPPLIYLVDGKLTTSLPEAPKVVKEEEFGLSLIRFEKKEYRLKLVSWIGQVPYFEDSETKLSDNVNQLVKNRIELKIPYKNNENYRPGLPSLVQTTMEDEKKVFMVEYFTVQQVKDPRTGGVKPVGRALVKDFIKGGKPFEINSRMDKVFSGDFQISLQVNLAGEIPQEININVDEVGKEITVGNRNFKILKINEENKTLDVEKRLPGKDEPIISTLSL